MSAFQVLGLLVSVVVVEKDAHGHIIGQQTLPPGFAHWPWGENCERVIERKLAELTGVAHNGKEDQES